MSLYSNVNRGIAVILNSGDDTRQSANPTQADTVRVGRVSRGMGGQ